MTEQTVETVSATSLTRVIPTAASASTPVAAVGTTTADPTLGLLSHAVALGVGALAGFLSVKFSVTFSPETQAEITTTVVTVAVTGVHYLQAYFSAKNKGA